MQPPNVNEAPRTPSRPRLLMGAFSCHPDDMMETRVGWRRAMLAARLCDVTVLVGPGQWRRATRTEELAERAAAHLGEEFPIRFVRVDHDWRRRRLCSTAATYYAGYRHWGTLAYRHARRMHDRRPFDLVHQVTYCGYREPGKLWKLGLPMVWGPIGGTQDFPLRFARVLRPAAAAREALRNGVNHWQLRHSRRVSRAAHHAAAVLAATRTNQRHLAAALGLTARVELETGLDCPIAGPRPLRDRASPLRVLWAGRLQPWKAFPLLARALAGLPATANVRVRVVGDGPCLHAWRQEVRRRGWGDRVEWRPWTEYRATLPHYRWADVFAFTSLRDTSGTGLLESLAAGAPIVGVDHQGAADIMTERCAIPVPVRSPAECVSDLGRAIATLEADPPRLKRMSDAARERAADFVWDARLQATREMYRAALAGAAHGAAGRLAGGHPGDDAPRPLPEGATAGAGCGPAS